MNESNATFSAPTRRNNVKAVLILSNDEALQAFLQAALEDAGYKAHTTWSGYEALALLEYESFEVVLTEDYLPDLHIHDFIRRVARCPNRPQIVVTQVAEPTADEQQRYTLLGVSAVVPRDDSISIRNAISACIGHSGSSHV